MEEKISDLEDEIKELQAERRNADGDERRDLLHAITARSNNLERLYTQLEREQQQQQGKVIIHLTPANSTSLLLKLMLSLGSTLISPSRSRLSLI